MLAPQKNGTWKYIVLHKFTGADGCFSWGDQTVKGMTFGATFECGKYKARTAFEIAR